MESQAPLETSLLRQMVWRLTHFSQEELIERQPQWSSSQLITSDAQKEEPYKRQTPDPCASSQKWPSSCTPDPVLLCSLGLAQVFHMQAYQCEPINCFTTVSYPLFLLGTCAPHLHLPRPMVSCNPGCVSPLVPGVMGCSKCESIGFYSQNEFLGQIF